MMAPLEGGGGGAGQLDLPVTVTYKGGGASVSVVGAGDTRYGRVWASKVGSKGMDKWTGGSLASLQQETLQTHCPGLWRCYDAANGIDGGRCTVWARVI